MLALDQLAPPERAAFSAGQMPGQLEQFAPVIPEPHGSWVDPIEREWLRRYGS